MEASDVGDGRTGKPSSCRKRKMPVPEIGGALTTEYQEEPTPSPSGDHPGNFASRDASPSRKRPRPVDECLIHPPDGSVRGHYFGVPSLTSSLALGLQFSEIAWNGKQNQRTKMNAPTKNRTVICYIPLFSAYYVRLRVNATKHQRWRDHLE